MKKIDLKDPQVKKDIEDNRIIAAIGYLGILFLLPLLIKPKSKFAQFHAKQGLVLFAGWVISLLLGKIPWIGPTLFYLGSVSIIIMSIVGIIKALQGQFFKMPYIYEYAKKV